MKCIKLKGKNKLILTTTEEPIIDNKHVIIKVDKCGICGSDLHNFELGNPQGLIMGHEFSGTVIDPGNRTDLKQGDRVTALPISPCLNCEACESGNVNYCKETWTHAVGLSLDYPGGLSEKVKVRSDMVIKLDNNITNEEAAMVEPTAVGLHAINLADIEIGDKVLIIGGGIIGLTSAMFAKIAGANKITLLETNPNRGEKALKLKIVDEFINVSNKEEYSKFLQQNTSSYDKTIECCGNSDAVTSALTFAKPGSTIVLVGVSPTPITTPSIIAVMNELKIIGAIAYTKEEFIRCIELISNKKIDVLKFLDETIPLDQTQEAYTKLLSPNNDAIKIMVDINK